MLIGYKNLENIFKKLVKSGNLSHGYIFFGEPQVGKYSFALSLASFLEKGSFTAKDTALAETFIIKPNEKGTIGIDTIHDLKRFLFKVPVFSMKRVIIIDNSEALTPQAQNAILKISEEPPKSSLIILITNNPEVLLDTLNSRLQKIYFPRFREKEIVKILENGYGIKKSDAEKFAKLSFGRPGRAIEFVTDKNSQGSYKEVVELLAKRKNKQEIITRLVNSPEELDKFFINLVAELAKEPMKNYDLLKSINMRLALMSQFTTNKRLQLESALWNI